MAALLPRAFHPRGVMKPSRIALAAAAAVTLVTSLVTAGTAADAASTTPTRSGSARTRRRATWPATRGSAPMRTSSRWPPRARPATRRPSCKAAYGITRPGRDHHGRRSSTRTPTRTRPPTSRRTAASSASALARAVHPVQPDRRLDPHRVSGNVGWGQEEMLDLEMVSAICPGCPILYVGANSASFTDLAAAVEPRAAKGAKVISNSYGGNEFSSETTLASAYNHPASPITASSGDSGYGAQAPAAFNTVVAVGGTHLDAQRQRHPQHRDRVERRRQRLLGVHRASRPGSTTPAAPSAPSVTSSAVADPATGVSVYDSYGSTGGNNWYVFGGTSVAAPIIGGVYGLSGDTARAPRRREPVRRTSRLAVRRDQRQQRPLHPRQEHRRCLPVHRCRAATTARPATARRTAPAPSRQQLHQRDRSGTSGRSRCTSGRLRRVTLAAASRRVSPGAARAGVAQPARAPPFQGGGVGSRPAARSTAVTKIPRAA